MSTSSGIVVVDATSFFLLRTFLATSADNVWEKTTEDQIV